MLVPGSLTSLFDDIAIYPQNRRDFADHFAFGSTELIVCVGDFNKADDYLALSLVIECCQILALGLDIYMLSMHQPCLEIRDLLRFDVEIENLV